MSNMNSKPQNLSIKIKSAFTLTEMLITMCVISILMALSVPLITQVLTSKTGTDKNVIACIAKNDTDGWYDEGTGVASVPDKSTDPQCHAAVVDSLYNRGRAITTAMHYANFGTSSQQTVAKKILRAACDEGGSKACDYFIESCRTKTSPTGNPYSYCDDTSSFLDLTYYLHQNMNTYGSRGAKYIYDELTEILPKSMSTPLVPEVLTAKNTNQSPDANQNLDNNIAHKLSQPSLYIKACNLGYVLGCNEAYDNNWNKSCSQVKKAWPDAPTDNYNLTYNYTTNNLLTLKPANCNMYSAASAAITGCSSVSDADKAMHCTYSPITDSTKCTDDCYLGFNNDYNRSCPQILAAWPLVPSGTYKLTTNGIPNLPSSGSNPPIATYCPAPDANCEASNGALCPDGSIHVGMVNGYHLYTTPYDEAGVTNINNYPWNNGTTPIPTTRYKGFTPVLGSNDGAYNQQIFNYWNSKGNGEYLTGTITDAPYLAAKACQNSTQVPAHTDWYLPSNAEIKLLYTHRNSGVLAGTFADTYYWRSDTESGTNAHMLSFTNGTENNGRKNLNLRVRCVRRNEPWPVLSLNYLTTRQTGDCSIPASQPIGTLCTDAAHLGQVFAGSYAGYQYYTTDADELTSTSWNNGTVNDPISAPLPVVVEAQNNTNGAANTIALTTPPVTTTYFDAPYLAALTCANYNVGAGVLGKHDWFLPSYAEGVHLCQNSVAIGKYFNLSHWTSSMASSAHYWEAYLIDYSSCTANDLDKQQLHKIRCVRKE